MVKQSTNNNKGNNHLAHQIFATQKKAMTYDIRNPDFGFG